MSTDEVLPRGLRVLTYRSNIERIAEFCFERVDEGYVGRARETGPHTLQPVLDLTRRQRDLLRAGGLVNWLRRRESETGKDA